MDVDATTEGAAAGNQDISPSFNRGESLAEDTIITSRPDLPDYQKC